VGCGCAQKTLLVGRKDKGFKSGAQPLNFLPRVYLAGWRLWVGGLKDDTCVVAKPPGRL